MLRAQLITGEFGKQASSFSISRGCVLLLAEAEARSSQPSSRLFSHFLQSAVYMELGD